MTLTFDQKEHLIRERLAKLNGFEILTKEEEISQNNNPAFYNQSGFEFSDNEITDLIKDGLINDEDELDRMYLDEIPTLDFEEMQNEFREGTHRSLDNEY